MIDISAGNLARNQFRANVLDHLVDVGDLSRWVLDHDLPLPEPDEYTPGCWVVDVWSNDAFIRLAALLGADAPTEVEEKAKYRTCRRRFGSVSLEVVQTFGEVA